MTGWRLLADVGGTNARFARLEPDGEIVAKRAYEVADFPDFYAALKAYLADSGGLEGCALVAVDAAGPVLNGEAQLTNAPWRISEAGISKAAGNLPARLFNDLEAVALALPHLTDAELKPLGKVPRPPPGEGRMLALNVGTGFGATMIFRLDGRWIPCPTEAGHMSFPAQDEAELALVSSSHFPVNTVEDALSGEGLVNLYRRECRRLRTRPQAATAKEVFACVPHDGAAKEALRVFTLWLGRVARDLALATSAWGGVFLCGGVVRGWSGLASARLFRSSFEVSGKMQERLRGTYTAVITRDDVSLLGLAHALTG